MNNETVRDEIKRLVEHVENRTADYAESVMTVDAGLYSDPHVAALERDHIFRNAAIVVGHQSEIPEPGEFLTLDVIDTPVLVIRQDDGSIQAFNNVCRHRGAQVESRPSGRRKMFTCPYHKWCYHRDGKLRSIPFDDGFAAIDRSGYGLQPIPTAIRQGLIWVSPNTAAAPDLGAKMDQDFGPELITQLAEFDIDNTWLFRKKTFDVPINWKIILEGFLDAYHLQFVHPTTVGPFFHTNVYTFEPHNKNSRILVARRGIEEVRDKDPATFNFRRQVATNYTIYPSTVIVPAPQHFEIWTILPHYSDPARSTVFIRILAPHSEQEERQRAYLDKNWELLCYALEQEDWMVSGTIMAGLRSRQESQFVLGRNEAVMQHFHKALTSDLAAAEAAE